MIKSFLILTLLKLALCKDLCIPQGNKCLYKWQCCKGFHCENPHYQDEKHCIADHLQLEHKSETGPELSPRTVWGEQPKDGVIGSKSERGRDPRIRPGWPKPKDQPPGSARHNDKPKSARGKSQYRSALDQKQQKECIEVGVECYPDTEQCCEPYVCHPDPAQICGGDNCCAQINPYRSALDQKQQKETNQETMMSLFEAGLQQLTQGKPIKMKVKVKNPEVLLSKLNSQPEPTPEKGEPTVDPAAFRSLVNEQERRKFSSPWGMHHYKEDSDSGMESKQDEQEQETSTKDPNRLSARMVTYGYFHGNRG